MSKSFKFPAEVGTMIAVDLFICSHSPKINWPKEVRSPNITKGPSKHILPWNSEEGRWPWRAVHCYIALYSAVGPRIEANWATTQGTQLNIIIIITAGSLRKHFFFKKATSEILTIGDDGARGQSRLRQSLKSLLQMRQRTVKPHICKNNERIWGKKVQDWGSVWFIFVPYLQVSWWPSRGRDIMRDKWAIGDS